MRYLIMLFAFDCTPTTTPVNASPKDGGGKDVNVAADVVNPDVVNPDVAADVVNPDVTTVDAGVIAVGPTQCASDSDCGAGLTCNANAPGGICLGCGTCPGDLVCTFGACVRECSTNSDCNVGFRCGGTGRCLLRSCTADEDCAPYVCGGTQCARPNCTTTCPAPFTCDGSRCIE